MFSGMVSCSSKSGPPGFKKQKYITLNDAGEDAISDMFIIGSDDEMHLEIEGETASQELSNEQNVRVKQVV
jgi:hypothetical protein